MDFEIAPYTGAGKIKLGMNKEEIKKVMEEVPRETSKAADKVLTDVFSCCFVYYNNSGISEAVEFFEPSMPTFQGIELMIESFENVKQKLIFLDHNLEIDDTGCTSYKYGFGLYAPFEVVESVIIFEKGYYD